MSQRKNGPASSQGQREIIEPIKFRPAVSTPQLPRIKLPWAHGFIGLVVLVAVWGAWYVITARSVSIVTEPEDARVVVDELFAPSIGGHWVLRPGTRSVVVEAPGYKPFNDELLITAEALQTHSITLDPLPGHLRVEVTPVNEANVTIDKLTEVTAPTTIKNIDAGPHEISVTAERYLSFATIVEIKGREIEQLLTVELKPAWADISIRSQPGGAAVTVDGIRAGTTPLDFELLQGKRVIELSLDGYKRWKRTIKVNAGTPLAPPLVLLSKADGYVNVVTSPVGASIMLGQEFKGQSPIKFAIAPDKKHTIAAHKEGYTRERQSLSVASGVTQDLTLELKPELAAVQIIATPQDAELIVDGAARGNANQTLQLTTHAHEIEIRKSGYVTYSASITPRKGIRKRVKVRLRTPAEAAKTTHGRPPRNPSQGVVKTFAGQEMKLFSGGPVTMGSSRRDPGRRANETLNEARLVRPFYFGLKEVTNGEFRRFLANHRVAPVNGIDVDGDTHPVVGVSWETAALFCNWLSRKDSLPVFYQIKNGKVLGIDPAAPGYRLPTEAEWSWVARTAPNTEKAFDYPWAGKFPPRGRSGNYADQSASRFLGKVIGDYNDGFPVTAPVGSFAANLRGIHDIGGNISEWVNDYYSAVPAESDGVVQDPLGPRHGESHVIRGSNWAHATNTELRLAYRDFGNDPRDDVGFRIARYAQ
ncbi:MAG: PEGA domain-containing protein [Gammaproteobacteria bacterium]|nr:PEGA domain-containing protein [Gammaproteobacteria bacterium]